MIASHYIICTNHFDRPDIKATIWKLTIFLLLLIPALNTIVHNQVVPKTVVKKFSFSKLKIEKVKFFTQSPTNFVELAFLTLEVA